MRIGYLLHSPVPGPTTNAEQAVNALAALRAHPDIAVDLWAPVERGGADGPHREADIVRYYGLPPGTFGDRLRLRDVALPRWSRGAMAGLVFDLRVPRWIQGERYDGLHVRDPLTLLRALATGLPVVFETYRTDLNHSPWWAAFRRAAYARANLVGVIAHSRVALDGFRARGFVEERLLLAYNGFTPAPAPGREAARQAVAIPGERPVVCYAGGVGRHKGIEALAALAARVPEADFLVVGAARESDVEPAWRAAGNLRILPRVPPASVTTYLAAADVLIIPPTAGPLRRSGRTVLPIKTFSYLAAGRPILAPALPDVAEVLSPDTAMLVPPDDLPAAAAALRQLLGDEPLRRRLAVAAGAAAKQYTWEARAARVAPFLRRCLASGRANS